MNPGACPVCGRGATRRQWWARQWPVLYVAFLVAVCILAATALVLAITDDPSPRRVVVRIYSDTPPEHDGDPHRPEGITS
jgi:hypothetical protein